MFKKWEIVFTLLLFVFASSLASADVLTASPSPVEIPSGSLGTTTISWPAQGVPGVSLYVSMDLGSETLVAAVNGTSPYSKTVTWIQRGKTYDFNLYDSSDNTGTLIDTIRVEGYKLLRANRYISVPSGTTGSCKVSFGASGYGTVQLYVSMNGNADQLVWTTGGTVPKSKTLTWIGLNSDYVFKLYANTDKTILLDQTTVTGSIHMPLETSEYLSLASNTYVSQTTELLSTEIDITGNEHFVYVQSDGRYYPMYYQEDVCGLYITVDGQRVSNKSDIDWYSTSDPVQHCFNCIGLVSLQSGTHKFALVAEHNGVNADYAVGEDANLSIMIDPAPAAMQTVLASDHTDVELDTDFYGQDGSTEGDQLPHETVVSHTFPSDNRDVVSMTSGVCDGIGGDAMWGIYLNNQPQGSMYSTWTVNDMWTNSEMYAPMYAQAYYPSSLTSSSDSVSFVATEFPWKKYDVEPDLVYDVVAGARLVSLGGGMSLSGCGHFVANPAYNFYQWQYKSIGGYESNVPPIGTNVEVVSETITIPTGHNGIVMFLAKARCQGDSSDLGGLVRLWIRVDGVFKGSMAIQQLNYPHCVSQRTLCASYLATGDDALSEGTHTISVYGKVEGTFRWLSLHRESALVWFD